MTETASTRIMAPFARGAADVAAADPAVVGAKAANLIRMAAQGMPVPPGFVLSTETCREYLEEQRRMPGAVRSAIEEGVAFVERTTGLRFGGRRMPLLVSVRSGSPVSMPGMMDTVLNVGLNTRTMDAMVRMTGNPRHAWDSFRRLIQTFGEVVRGAPARAFENVIRSALSAAGVPAVDELGSVELRDLAVQLLEVYRQHVGEPFPEDPMSQLEAAIGAVFRSWEGRRAVEYRRMHGLSDDVGTAVTVQAMVFGNAGARSGAGVGFTRDPSTGDRALYLDFVRNAQGEDVVSGRCTVGDAALLERVLPDVHAELWRTAHRLERLFGDVQDFEFTVQDGALWLLQSRDAKRTPLAALRSACGLVDDGVIDEKTALERLLSVDLDSIQTVRAAPHDGCEPLARGTPAVPGVVTGPVAFTPEDARELRDAGRPAILIRTDIATDDVEGIAAAGGVLTTRGGRTSHAAVVARQLDRVCVVGCSALRVGEGERSARLGSTDIASGDVLSIDGHTGAVYVGEVEVESRCPEAELARVREWAE